MKPLQNLLLYLLLITGGFIIGLTLGNINVTKLQAKHTLALEVAYAERSYTVELGQRDAKRLAAEIEMREYYRSNLLEASRRISEYAQWISDLLIAGRETLNQLEEIYGISQVPAR